MTESYPIYQSLWESLDAILIEKGRRLAMDIAKELDVPCKPLLDALKNNPERGKFCILSDEDTAIMQCQALIHQGSGLLRCRKPVYSSAPRYCSEHSKYTMDVPLNLPSMRRIICKEDVYFEKDKILYSRNGVRCGFLEDENHVVLFAIE